jgi:S1-C subfamily serine protease
MRGASAGTVKVVGLPTTYTVNGLVALDADADLVLLTVLGVSAPTLQLSQSDDLAVGDVIYAIGNPKALKGPFLKA